MTAPKDDPYGEEELQRTIKRKPVLRLFYTAAYAKFAECLTDCPDEGLILEIGSGAGFIKDFIPEAITSDFIRYSGVDGVVDARHMPFPDSSLRAMFLLDAFHHISDPAAFLKEVERCLVPGGRMLMVDQHCGWISKPILKYFHSEPYDDRTKEWRFQSNGAPVSANGALPWIVFQRDRKLFEERFPALVLQSYRTHTPLLYWLSGGLKKWSLVTPGMVSAVKRFESMLLRLSPDFGSFVDIEIVKRKA